MCRKTIAIRTTLTMACILAAGCQKSDVMAQDPQENTISATATDARSDADARNMPEDSNRLPSTGLPETGTEDPVLKQNANNPEKADAAKVQPSDNPNANNPEKADAAKVQPSDNPNDNTAANGCPDIRSNAPLCAEQMEILANIQQDPEPEVLYAVHTETIGRHYLVSDEKHPELFKETIENKGGTYMGVGFEQGYLYVGWLRPSLVFLIDYDPWVVLNHRVLVEVMKTCDDAQCLYNHFSKRDVAEAFLNTQQAIDAGFAEKENRHRIHRLRYAVTQALAKLRDSELPTMMNRPEIYQFIRELVLSGRLRVVQANLLESGSIESIAGAMNQLGASLQTLYLSNAEQYWNYSDQFKKNMLALPFAKDGIIMRTRATYPRNSDYRYSIQPASIFKIWMAHPKTRAVKPMTKHVSIRKPDQFPFVIDDLLPE